MGVNSHRDRRPRQKSKGAKTWKRLDYQDQSDIDISMLGEPPYNFVYSPLDAHAKTFRPSSSSSNIFVNAPGGMASVISPSTTPEPEVQILTNPRSRPSGLNAYEIKPETVNATVTASFSRRDIVDVFGGDLPSPDVCQSIAGIINGQVQFCVHPNGDVSAQQWSSSSYQWLNIGQFSNIRKRTEGQLASDRLRGETEQQSLQQKTLGYFRAIAKQREASVMRTPFAAAQQFAESPVVNTPGSTRDVPRHVSGTSQTSANSFDVKGQNGQIRNRLAGAPRPTVNVLSSRPGYGRRAPALAGSKEWLLRHFGQEPTRKTPTQLILGSRSPQETGTLFGAPWGFGRDSASQVYPLSSSLANADNEARPRKRLNEFFKDILDSKDEVQRTLGQRDENQSKATPIKLSSAERLKQLAQDGALTPAPAVQRTVLHDPLRSASRDLLSIRESKDEFKSVSASPVLNLTPRPRVSEHATPTSYGGKTVLFDSDPEPASPLAHDNRPFRAWNDTLLSTPPTVQNWDGPFFSGDSQLYKVRPGAGQSEGRIDFGRANDLKTQRHDEFYDSIVAANSVKSTLDAMQNNKGSSDAEGEGSRLFDPTCSRLLIPVIENLSLYKESAGRGGSMTPYCTPPEWSIDHGPGGNDSFFEESWGRVPDRIGRDERYRHVSHEERYGRVAESRRAVRGPRGRIDHIVPRVPSSLAISRHMR